MIAKEKEVGIVLGFLYVHSYSCCLTLHFDTYFFLEIKRINSYLKCTKPNFIILKVCLLMHAHGYINRNCFLISKEHS